MDNKINYPVKAMTVTTRENGKQDINVICSNKDSIIQWSLENGAWRIEDGAGVHSECTCLAHNTGEDGVVIAVGTGDGSLTVFKVSEQSEC